MDDCPPLVYILFLMNLIGIFLCGICSTYKSMRVSKSPSRESSFSVEDNEIEKSSYTSMISEQSRICKTSTQSLSSATYINSPTKKERPRETSITKRQSILSNGIGNFPSAHSVVHQLEPYLTKPTCSPSAITDPLIYCRKMSYNMQPEIHINIIPRKSSSPIGSLTEKILREPQNTSPTRTSVSPEHPNKVYETPTILLKSPEFFIEPSIKEREKESKESEKQSEEKKKESKESEKSEEKKKESKESEKQSDEKKKESKEREKESEEREKESEEREKESEEREKESEERQKEPKEREEKSEEREKEYKEREKEFKEREKKSEEREKTVKEIQLFTIVEEGKRKKMYPYYNKDIKSDKPSNTSLQKPICSESPIRNRFPDFASPSKEEQFFKKKSSTSLPEIPPSSRLSSLSDKNVTTPTDRRNQSPTLLQKPNISENRRENSYSGNLSRHSGSFTNELSNFRKYSDRTSSEFNFLRTIKNSQLDNSKIKSPSLKLLIPNSKNSTNSPEFDRPDVPSTRNSPEKVSSVEESPSMTAYNTKDLLGAEGKTKFPQNYHRESLDSKIYLQELSNINSNNNQEEGIEYEKEIPKFVSRTLVRPPETLPPKQEKSDYFQSYNDFVLKKPATRLSDVATPEVTCFGIVSKDKLIKETSFKCPFKKKVAPAEQSQSVVCDVIKPIPSLMKTYTKQTLPEDIDKKTGGQ